jgi:hypothetical protein
MKLRFFISNFKAFLSFRLVCYFSIEMIVFFSWMSLPATFPQALKFFISTTYFVPFGLELLIIKF